MNGSKNSGNWKSILLTLVFASMASSFTSAAENLDDRFVTRFIQVLSADGTASSEALTELSNTWQTGYVAPLLEIASLTSNRQRVLRVFDALRENTGQSFNYDVQQWYGWLWDQDYESPPEYADFKAWLFSNIDPKFEGYFSATRASTIRLDEVRWGGVIQDGIPPLRQPNMISAEQADYLDDRHIVFGVEINGDARAYPKRILAWHEMFVDDVGGLSIAGVYCTLCGAVVIYETEVDGINHQLGTSGFLYRSNKLMYDQQTQSLWNTLWGKPVIGPLIGNDIQLKKHSVVTSTWGEWRRRHPQTQVLSLDTGHRRDYAEGAAYREYFASDELMFNVPELDRRLRNKDEVLGIVLPDFPDQPLAVSADFLLSNPLLHEQIGDQRFVIVTDTSGANRVYDAASVEFVDWDGDHTLKDSTGQSWELQEARLVNSDSAELLRVPAHRSFWFGWYSAYDHTRLIH